MRRRALLPSLPLSLATATAPGRAAASTERTHRPGHPPLRVLVYGDSNTWGLQPVLAGQEAPRYPEDAVWPAALGAVLGPRAVLRVQGLPGRTLATDLPHGIAGLSGEDHNGLKRFSLALLAEGPCHVVVLMLGTNDLIDALDRPVDALVREALPAYAARVAQGTEAHPAVRGPRWLVIAPPPLGDVQRGDFREDFGVAAQRQSPRLAGALAQAARAAGAAFADAAAWTATDGVDGLHLSRAAHRRLGRGAAAALQGLLSPP